jgi:hypothetical protein
MPYCKAKLDYINRELWTGNRGETTRIQHNTQQKYDNITLCIGHQILILIYCYINKEKHKLSYTCIMCYVIMILCERIISQYNSSTTPKMIFMVMCWFYQVMSYTHTSSSRYGVNSSTSVETPYKVAAEP